MLLVTHCTRSAHKYIRYTYCIMCLILCKHWVLWNRLSDTLVVFRCVIWYRCKDLDMWDPSVQVCVYHLFICRTSRSFTRVELESHKRRLSVAVRTTCTIIRAAQYIDYADPSVAQRKHCVCGEIPSLAKVNVNKVAIFYGIIWNGINWTGMFFLSKCTYVHSVKPPTANLMNRG